MFSWLNEKRTNSFGTGFDAVGFSAQYQLVAHEALADDSPLASCHPLRHRLTPTLMEG